MEVAPYVHRPGVREAIERDRENRALRRAILDLEAEMAERLEEERERTRRYRKQAEWAHRRDAEKVAAEINAATAAYVDEIQNLKTYIAFLERNETP